eukprot:scaffold1127_cov160-Amphora_coffeaeformis.AAC.3
MLSSSVGSVFRWQFVAMRRFINSHWDPHGVVQFSVGSSAGRSGVVLDGKAPEVMKPFNNGGSDMIWILLQASDTRFHRFRLDLITIVLSYQKGCLDPDMHSVSSDT